MTQEAVDTQPTPPEDESLDEDREPNGIRYSKGQDPFYLMHENQLASMLRRAHAGETPDDLMTENWINTQVMHEDDENIELGDDETAVIMVDLDEEEDENA